MGDNVLSNSQKVTLAATLGTGILVGAAGVAVYQRLNKVGRYKLIQSKQKENI